MKIVNLFLGFSLLVLTACGPIIGGMMASGGGVKDFKVTSGNLSDLKPGSHIVVLGPFDTTDMAFHICHGEDAAALSGAFNRSGLFISTLKIDERFPEPYPVVNSYQGQTAQQVQAALALEQAPDLLLSGIIMKREMVTAPAQGVMMRVRYQLNLLVLATGKLVQIEVEANDLFEKCVPEIVAKLQEQIVGG